MKNQYQYNTKLQDELTTQKLTVVEQEELCFNVETTETHWRRVEELMNDEQNTFYSAVIQAVRSEEGGAFFLSAVGGTGKTFVINGLLAKVSFKYCYQKPYPNKLAKVIFR